MATDGNDSGSSEPADRAGASTEPREAEPTTSTVLNGIIGGIVGVVLFFVPFSTVLGGGVAGYLEGGEFMDGAKVGAIAGVVAMLPFLLVAGVIALLTPIFVGAGPRAPLALGFMLVFVFVMATVYVVGLSVLGGIVGAYLKTEL